MTSLVESNQWPTIVQRLPSVKPQSRLRASQIRQKFVPECHSVSTLFNLARRANVGFHAMHSLTETRRRAATCGIR